MHVLHFQSRSSYCSLSFFFVRLFHGATSSFLTTQVSAIWTPFLATPVKTHQNSRKGFTNSNAHKGQESNIDEYVSEVWESIGNAETTGKPETRGLATGI